MAELRELQRKLESIDALEEIVQAMRNLAAVYVRRAEQTLEATRPYSSIVETALAEVLRRLPGSSRVQAGQDSGVALVFSSDQGLCGTFNERIVGEVVEFREAHPGIPVMVVGLRGRELLRQKGIEPGLAVPAPTSLEGVRVEVREISRRLFGFVTERGADTLYFVYNRYVSMGAFEETVRRVLPPGKDQLAVDSESLSMAFEPILSQPPECLLKALIEEYFFIQLFRALLESHASENGARLTAMSSASTNIDKRSAQLRKEYQTARQEAVTSELLDVVGGAEAMSC